MVGQGGGGHYGMVARGAKACKASIGGRVDQRLGEPERLGGRWPEVPVAAITGTARRI